MFLWSGEEAMTKEIHSILAAAADDVEKSGVPDDLRAAAFGAAIAMRTAAATPDAGTLAGGESAAQNRDPGDWRALVSTAFDVSSDDIDEAFDLVDGRMHLTIPPSRLPHQKAAAMKDVALLVSAARQAAGIDGDGWTSVGVIRDECRDIGVLDVSNFAAEIQLRDVMTPRGNGRSRVLRVNRRGYEQAGNRLRELLAP